MNIESIGFIMTDKCSAACRICCFSCTPENNMLLDKELMKDYIRQAHDLKTIRSVAFSGGEAIMYYEQLKECVAYACGFGMRTSLVTNGFWAKNEKKGNQMMEELVAAGLSNVSFSVDSFHQEYVSYETVAQAMRICERLGVFSSATIMDVIDGRNVREVLEHLRGELYNKDLTIYPVFPAGSAAENVPREQIIRECIAHEAVCPFEKSISFLFDGVMRMCCTQFSHHIDMVELGKFGKTSLKDAIAAFHNNDYLYVLLKNQFSWYVNTAKNIGIPVSEKYSIPCELCYELFTNLDFVEYMHPRVQEEANRLRMEKLFN